MSLPEEIFTLCDYITPNEVEAEQLSGIRVNSIESAKLAAEKFCQMGVKNSIITLGDQGAYFHNFKVSTHVPAFDAGKTKETTGAGDAFNGAFAAALSRGESGLRAVEIGCAAAAISVTRQGTSDSMPLLSEVEVLLKQHFSKTNK
jgi:ribokinase